ncbi:zinc finger lsd1 subclass family isoform A [Micractinium conductrix]|uniref:Zinc finger lsd1 subclass family isoform A n=1 Tax=Micractinium conductrix TaxID=554055 RepID=A0A2P6VQM7_9CHLO|nr:zinc finger lsd1 subclass family isoform A [Micractinium conductrix]|eukprot:PSC76389.1 zinc finger lsd1 subclass family isoform A [Micractinium conductrix]
MTQGGTVLDRKQDKFVKCQDPLCGKCDPADPSTCHQCQKEPYWSYWGDDYGVVYLM